MKTIGLFSGIGGLELPLQRRGAEAVLLCDNWAPAQRVLGARFPEADLRACQSALKRDPV